MTGHLFKALQDFFLDFVQVVVLVVAVVVSLG